MNGLIDFINRLLGGVLKLALALAAGVFLLSLLLAALVVVLVFTLWSLLTGRRPAPAKVFGQFRQASQRYTGRTWPGGAGTSPPGSAGHGTADVVDVHAREVPDTPDAKAKPDGAAPRQGPDPMARAQH